MLLEVSIHLFSIPFLFCRFGYFIGLMSSMFANGPGDRGSIPGRVVPTTQKMVLDAALLNTQHYKVRIKGKVQQSREWSNALPYTSVWEIWKRESSGYPRLRSWILFTYSFIYFYFCWYSCNSNIVVIDLYFGYFLCISRALKLL